MVTSDVFPCEDKSLSSSTPSSAPQRPLFIDPDTGEEVYRHFELWFNDGSVVLRAENTLFRVHMSQLARHSVCFRDMVALASCGTRTDKDTLDGCPLICLHDSANDLEALLFCIYDGPRFGDNGEEDFLVTSGVLRLATKYIVDLREKALAHLSTAWPSTLQGWDKREDYARYVEMNTPHQGRVYPSPIAVINLANEVDAPSLLPSAFYDLCRQPFCQIFEAMDEDTLQRHSLSLNLSDTQRLCLGKESAQHTITTLIQGMGTSQYVKTSYTTAHHGRKSSGNGVCTSATACRKDFAELVDLATQHYIFDRERGSCDPLYVAEELGQLKSAEFSECKPCALSLEAWAARERNKMWKMIPIWFRLQEFAPSPRATSPRLIATSI